MAKSDAHRPLELVRSVAYSIVCRLPAHVDVNDLISAGSIGYMAAVERYEPRRGSFREFASIKIRGAIIDSLRRQSPGMRYRQNRMPFIVAMEDLPEVAVESNVFEVIHVQGMLPRLAAALTQLSDRHRFVVERSFYDGEALSVIGKELGLHESRISQLRTEALNKLRELLDVTNAD